MKSTSQFFKFSSIDTNPINTQPITYLPLKHEILQIPAYRQAGFKGVLMGDGLPQLNAKEWARMMNIASIEYAILKLQKVREMSSNGPEPNRYD